MKNIENRVAKLEQQIPANDFLVVMAESGESREAAIKRAIKKTNANRMIDEFFVIFLNLHRNL